ncbi:MAG: hypothetical protein ITG02_13275 [Patulibacter sp.]|nr:hypothetical protein [Patulibacter sp.]
MQTASHRRYRPGTQLDPVPVPVRWRRAAELAARQHGVVSRVQLRRCDLSDRQITRATAMSRLHAVHRGVFAVGHDRLSASGQRAAAVLACGAGAALGYRAAAAHWNLRATSSPTVEIVVARTSRPHHRNVKVHCHPQIEPDELTDRDGIRVTTVARTLLDLAAVLPPAALRRSVGQADVLRLFDRHAVAPLLVRHRHHRGRKALEAVLRTWEEPERVRSPQEETFPELCARFGFPRPAINAEVLGMEVDAVFFDHGIAVELDGYAFHSGAIQWEDDHEKRARLVAAGWTVLAYSWRQVRDDGGGLVRETLGAALARASTDARHRRYRRGT